MSKRPTCIGLSPSLVTFRVTASLPKLSTICPRPNSSSPGILPPSIIGNFSSEGTAEATKFLSDECLKINSDNIVF